MRDYPFWSINVAIVKALMREYTLWSTNVTIAKA